MKIFLATSFSSKVDVDGRVIPAFKNEVEKLIARYEGEGHEVFCAIRTENWKVAEQDPTKALELDFKHIRECDEFMALVEPDVSAGVQLEIGYALALKKQVCLLTKPGERLGWTNEALTHIASVKHETL